MASEYMRKVHQRVALYDAEKYLSYARQDKKDGKRLSAAIYTRMARFARKRAKSLDQ